MKNFFKNLISRKEKQESSISNNSRIDFEDLKLQNLFIDLIKTGNDTVLRISEQKSGFEMILDKEKSFLLSVILQNYTADNNLEKVIKALEEKE